MHVLSLENGEVDVNLSLARGVKFYQDCHNHRFELIGSLMLARKAFESVKK